MHQCGRFRLEVVGQWVHDGLLPFPGEGEWLEVHERVDQVPLPGVLRVA